MTTSCFEEEKNVRMKEYDNMESIDLDYIVWKITKYNDSVLKTRDGRVLIGPGSISLWGNYPYIAGYVNSNGNKKDFVIDVRDYNISNSIDDYLYTSVYAEGFNPKSVDTNRVNIVYTTKGTVKLIPYRIKGPGIDVWDFVTFGSLRGQWEIKGKLDELKENMRDKSLSIPKEETKEEPKSESGVESKSNPEQEFELETDEDKKQE